MMTSFLMSYVALGLIALQKPKHWQLSLSRYEFRPVVGIVMYRLGWGLLVASLIISISSRGVGVGIVEYVGGLSVAGFILALQIAYAPVSVLAVNWLTRLVR